MRHAWPAVLVLCTAIGSGTAQQSMPRMTVFPQIVAGGPWSSDFYITNQGLSSLKNVELSIFKDDGTPMEVETPDLGAASLFQFGLNAGETWTLRATRGSSVTDVAGFAELYCPPGADVRATVIIRYAPGGILAGQLGIPEQFPFSHFSFPGEIGPQANTGMAIAIPTYRYSDIPDQKVIVSVLNPGGALAGTKSLPLSAGRHASFFLGELFPDLKNFSGRVAVSGPDWLGVTAIRIEGATLGAVSVDEGSALAPYFVSADSVDEAEPNDDRNTAQAIAAPSAVSAAIGFGTDVDYYRFAGRQGEILSAFVEALDTASSDFDPQLSLVSSAGVEISWNDQNGNAGNAKNDPLIRMVLPATGDYFLKVSDYHGNGGASFRYRLHLKIQAP